MRPFRLKLTGDLCNADGTPAGDLAFDLLASAPEIQCEFIQDQRPQPNHGADQDRLYAMQIEPRHVADADALIVCRPWVKAAAFAAGAESLVAINRAGIGYDKIDLPACTAHDVVVFNSPHGMTHSTAAAALFFVLGLSKRYPQQERILRTRRWDLQKEGTGDDLTGRTLAIIGLGQTGMELASLLAPFRMRLIAYSPRADPLRARAAGVELVPDLRSALQRADYVSLHCRLDPGTRGLIGEPQLRQMKPTAYLVNVARGELVDEPALIRALQTGQIAGAGLDVFATEPLPASSPLLGLENVMLTPHWLPATRQAGRATAVSIMAGMLRVARGELPEHILNPAVLERSGFQQKLRRYAPASSAKT